jgi:glutathione peroxidase
MHRTIGGGGAAAAKSGARRRCIRRAKSRYPGMSDALRGVPPMPAAESPAAGAHRFSFAGLDGGDLPLAAWRGRPVLVVNTASFCGYTPQYRDLEAVWQRYRGRGLIVLGVPCNDFGAQEPGSAAEIRQFCEANYGVGFPLTEKVRVIGAAAHPFYRWVAEELGEAGAPRWNFHKYLVGPDGELAGAWPSQVRPTDPAVTGEIERLLPAG